MKSIAERLRRRSCGPLRSTSIALGATVIIGERFDCDGVVCVADADGERDARLAQLRAASTRATMPTAVGIAVEAIEAWTLGAHAALAAELGLEEDVVRRAYPKIHVENLKESSGKEGHRPKPLLNRLAGLAHRVADTALRRAVAERTNPADLAAACPAGFAQFITDVQRALAEHVKA